MANRATISLSVALAVLVAAATWSHAATIFWLSEPASPGDTVLAYGGDLAQCRTASLARLQDEDPGLPTPTTQPSVDPPVAVPVQQPSDNSVKFLLPPDGKPGLYSVDIAGAKKVLNLPAPLWCQPTRLAPGLRENELYAGCTVQLIGRNLTLTDPGPAPRLALLPGTGGPIPLKLLSAEKYALTAQLPADLPEGDYKLFAHNAYGGRGGWSAGLPVRVRRPDPWPTATFDVRSFGAKGDGVSDDGPAVRAALAAAAKNNGGVVTLPPGTFRVAGPLVVPPRTTVRGAGRDLTWLKWPQTNPRSPADFIPAAVITNSQFELADLSIVVRNARDAVVDLSWAMAMQRIYGGDFAPVADLRSRVPRPGEARDIFFRNVRVRYVPFVGRPSSQPTLDPQWSVGRWGLADTSAGCRALALGGATNVEISGCDLVGTERVLDVGNARITGSTFSNQLGVAWLDLGGQYVVLESNRLVASSSFRPFAEPVRYVYAAHNTSTNLAMGEREAMTFDANYLLGRRGPEGETPGAAYAVAASATGTSVRVRGGPAMVPNKYVGFDAQVVAGRGAGQYRAVTANGIDDLTVTPAWDVPPDRSSVLVLHRVQGHVILYANRAEDASVLGQIWGTLFDATFDSNTVDRGQGMWGLSGTFVQYLGNRLNVAVSFHPGVGPVGDTPEHTAEYGVLGFVAAGAFDNLPLHFPQVTAAVFRSNDLAYGHRILVMHGYGGPRRRVPYYVAQDLVVDRNRIAHTAIGIETDPNCVGVLLNANRFDDVPVPVKQWTAGPR